MYEVTVRELLSRHGSLNVSFNYRWEHVTAVVTLAMQLARLTGADEEIVEAAAWLHDVSKATHGEAHPEAGAAFARAFLAQTDFPSEKIEAVASVIETHKGLWREEPLDNLEAQVLWDADKLAKIGLTAAFHWTGRSLAGAKLQTTEEIIRRGRAADWQEKTVDSMHTEPARRAAERRLRIYNWLWDELERELTGDDLVDNG
jgi:putative nucleotidyltransferase with HDIG domain